MKPSMSISSSRDPNATRYFLRVLLVVVVVFICFLSLGRQTIFKSEHERDDSTSYMGEDDGDNQVKFYLKNQKPLKEEGGKRIGLCIAGLSRTFYSIPVYESILNNVLKPLEESNDNKNVLDVIFNIHLTLHNSNPDEAQPAMQLSKPYLRAILQQFKPVYIYESSSRDAFNLDNYTTEMQYGRPYYLYRPETCGNTSHDRAIIPFSLHQQYGCKQRILEYEKKSGYQYDYIYVIRPDMMFIQNDIILPDQIQNGTLYTNSAPVSSNEGFQNWWDAKPEDEKILLGAAHGTVTAPDTSDQIMAATRSTAMIAMEAVNMIQNCIVFDAFFLMNTENQLTLWAMTHGLLLESVPMFAAIVRFYMGMECHVFASWTKMFTTASGENQTAYEACYQLNREKLLSHV